MSETDRFSSSFEEEKERKRNLIFLFAQWTVIHPRINYMTQAKPQTVCRRDFLTCSYNSVCRALLPPDESSAQRHFFSPIGRLKMFFFLKDCIFVAMTTNMSLVVILVQKQHNVTCDSFIVNFPRRHLVAHPINKTWVILFCKERSW